MVPLNPVDPVLPASKSDYGISRVGGKSFWWHAQHIVHAEVALLAWKQSTRAHLWHPPRRWSLSGRCHLSLLLCQKDLTRQWIQCSQCCLQARSHYVSKHVKAEVYGVIIVARCTQNWYYCVGAMRDISPVAPATPVKPVWPLPPVLPVEPDAPVDPV